MPLPLFLGIGAAIAGAAGLGGVGYGAKKMKESNEMQKNAQSRYTKKLKSLEAKNQKTLAEMDKLGELELEIINSFSSFQSITEVLQNRPLGSLIENKVREGTVDLPKYDRAAIKQASTGAAVLIGGLGSAALGTAGGFAAAGATTAAVMALGTASTGTAIASLSGVAATNATLAALGGGALAAGGGGMALGSMVLGGATLGVGLLVGGIIFGITGKSISGKAEDVVRKMKKAESEMDKIMNHLHKLGEYAVKYRCLLTSVYKIYQQHMDALGQIVNIYQKRDWNEFTDWEKKLVDRCELLVAILYNMCNIQFVLKADNANSVNQVNATAIDAVMLNTTNILKAQGFAIASI